MTTTNNMKDGNMNHGRIETIINTKRSNASLAERAFSTVAGTALSLAFAIVGAILALSIRT